MPVLLIVRAAWGRSGVPLVSKQHCFYWTRLNGVGWVTPRGVPSPDPEKTGNPLRGCGSRHGSCAGHERITRSLLGYPIIYSLYRTESRNQDPTPSINLPGPPDLHPSHRNLFLHRVLKHDLPPIPRPLPYPSVRT